MAFEYYAAIALRDETLYVTNSETSIVRTVGGVPMTFRPVLRIKKIAAAFASITLAKENPASATFELDNVREGGPSGWLDKYLGLGVAKKTWNNRVVTLKYGGSNGSAWESMTMVNSFVIRPSTLRHNRATVEFSAVDIRILHDKPILSERYTPDAEDTARGSFVAVVFGDFTQGPGPTDGGRLRAFCEDMAAYQFRIADHAIGTGANPHISVWHHDQDGGPGDTPVVRLLTFGADFTEDLTNARFTLTPGYVATYPPDFNQDRFTVNCTGVAAIPLVTGGGSVTLQKAPDIIAYILTQYGGALTSELDLSGTWLTAYNESDRHSNRKWIGEQQLVMDAVGELLRENNLELFTDAGRYLMRFYDPSSDVVLMLHENQSDDDGITAEYDPGGEYTNRIIAQYDRNVTDPSAGEFRGITEENDTDAQTDYGSVETSEQVFEWLPTESSILTQLQRQLLLRSGAAHYARLTISESGITPGSLLWRLRLGDSIALSGWQYSESVASVRAVEFDYEKVEITLMLLIVQGSFEAFYWSSDTMDSVFPASWSSDVMDATQPGKWS